MPHLLRARIYSASFGGGHHQANTALGDALTTQDTRIRARHTDYLTHLSGFERAVILGFYLGWLRYTPGIYRWYYHFTTGQTSRNSSRTVTAGWGGHHEPRTARRCAGTGGQQLPDARRRVGLAQETRGLTFLNVLVVTDYRIHEHWVRHEADLMLVPTDEARLQMIERGIPAERVKVTGIPINARYRALIGSDKTALRKKHGLDPELPLLLLSGGGQGTYRSLKRVLNELGNLGRRVQVLVLAGAGRVGVEQFGGATIHRLGFTTDFPELLAASDLVVGKAGGLTVAESTTLGVPMVVFDPIPGQEEYNAEYLERGGAAVWVHTLAGLRPAVLKALQPDEHARLSAGARALSVPDAADRAARIIPGDAGAAGPEMKRLFRASLWLTLLLTVYIGLPYVLVQHLNLGLLGRGSGRKREAALTFDDGPDPLTTPAVLDVLAAAGVQATFFVLAPLAHAHPHLIARMRHDGHEVELHAQKHVHAWIRTPWGASSDPVRGASVLAEVMGERPRYHRPPHGAYTLATILGQWRAGLRGAHWSIEAHDWHPAYTPAMVQWRVLAQLVPGAIIVMHDAGKGAVNCVPALPGLIREMQRRGYAFARLDALT